jgi:allantoicase
MEAFRSHPRIGEQKAAEQVSRDAQQWSQQEQSAARSASMETKNELIELNRQYEERFGFIFIVCADGKSADEILSVLKQRLKNEAEEELRIAANEQAKITELRLAKLINQ